MTQPNQRKHMIYFECDGKAYVVDAAELAGVAGSCPFVTYPGLPVGVLGLTQWSGKVFPVVDLFGRGAIDPASCTFLFSLDNQRPPLKEVAIAVSGMVRVFFVAAMLPPPKDVPPIVVAELVDPDGKHALQIRISKLVEIVLRAMAAGAGPGSRREGRKNAA